MAIFGPYIDASREVVLVGHDAPQDIQYLKSLGVHISDIPAISQILDSQKIHQAWKGDTNGRKLETVLADLSIESKNLHNAGNDAVFTLRALVGVSLEALRQEKMQVNGEVYEPELWGC